MRKISLQWRITLMTVFLIGVTCVAMNLLLCSSGVYYMDTIAETLRGGDTVIVRSSSGAMSCGSKLTVPSSFIITVSPPRSVSAIVSI